MRYKYAMNLAGTVAKAYDDWSFAKDAFERERDSEIRAIYAGQCSALGRIIRHATGRPPSHFESRAALLRMLED